MRVLKDNFKSGQPSSAVSSDWLNSVAKFINKLTGARGIVINRSGEFPSLELAMPSTNQTEDKVLTLKANSLNVAWESHSGEMGENPIDNRSASPDDSEPSTLTFTNWTAGGDNGLKIRLYGLVQNEGGAHVLQPVDLEIASNGNVKSVTSPSEGHGIWISA